ncbi:MAG TPA: hypothetical protein VNO32_25755 [Candidatus Acidoferrum sp.]|nr:hypothetical protein [Candidatus Acidoferrum sp.]
MLPDVSAVSVMRKSTGSFAFTTISRLLGIALMTSLLVLASDIENSGPTTISIGGGRIDVFTAGQVAGVTHEDLIGWVSAASRSVTTYFGRYPLPHVTVRITTSEGRGVRNGRTFGWPAAHINISVGRETTLADLKRDWTMTHEMIHLAFPSVLDKHHWIEEGIATYVEPIARVQSGSLELSKMWSDVIRDLPQGLPAPGDQGLDVTHTWGRTYWGGALFCLLADVEIRKRTRNQRGLEDALRGILVAGGNITQDWPLERALTAGDDATGTSVLENFYREMKDKPVAVDLASMWKDLGIQRSQNGDISFNDDAPLAAVRKSITAAPNLR